MFSFQGKQCQKSENRSQSTATTSWKKPYAYCIPLSQHQGSHYWSLIYLYNQQNNHRRPLQRVWSKIVMVSVFILLSKIFDICVISGAGIELMFTESPAGGGGNSILEVFHRITEGLTLIDHSMSQHASKLAERPVYSCQHGRIRANLHDKRTH